MAKLHKEMIAPSTQVEQYIRKKTHKPNALKFWVEGSVILLCGLTHFLILMRSLQLYPSYSLNTSHNYFLIVCLTHAKPLILMSLEGTKSLTTR